MDAPSLEVFKARLDGSLSNLVLNTVRDGASTASVGSLFQHLTTLIVKNFPLISNLNLPFLCQSEEDQVRPYGLVIDNGQVVQSLVLTA